MARLVIGTSKAKTVPALVKEVGPVYYKEFNVNNGTMTKKTNQIVDFEGVTTVAEGVLDNLFKESTVAPDFKNVTSIGSMVGSFQNPHFSDLDFKNVTTIGDMTNAFSGHVRNSDYMHNVNFGNVTSITNATSCFSSGVFLSFTAPNLTTIGIASQMFYNFGYTMASSWRLSVLDLSALTTITGRAQQMFYNAQITRVILSGLNSAGAAYGSGSSKDYTYMNMFQNASTTHIDLSGLTSLKAGFHMFYQCSLQYVNFKSLESLPIATYLGAEASDGALDSAFQNSAIRVVRFPSLTSVGKYSLYAAFAQSNYATIHVYFYHHLDVIDNLQSMCSNKNGITVHFPISEQAVIGSASVVTGGFSNNTTTVLFDIVTTATGADGNDYVRQQKDSVLDNDFEPTATAWVYNNTLYYTSGSAEPAVGDNIYSDSACSIVATTVSAIA